jgi:hypothetical protein
MMVPVYNKCAFIMIQGKNYETAERKIVEVIDGLHTPLQW